MAITRDPSNASRIVDWTDSINNLDNQYGLIRNMGLFRNVGVASTSITFDKVRATTTILPQVSRRSNGSVKGNERKVETFALPLGYFKHTDYITSEDVQNVRLAGTPDQGETVANVVLEKLTDARRNVEQTLEYLMLQAVKGICKDADGNVLANMFTEFNISQPVVAFDLSNPNTDVDAKIAELKRTAQAGLKTGGVIQGFDVIVSNDLFDALISHPQVRSAYQMYLNSGVQRLRDDLQTMMAWGALDVFEHRGVRFMTYNASFNKIDGTTEAAVASGEGHLIIRGPQDLYRGYFGPANKLAAANQPGRDMFAYQYNDEEGSYIKLEAETAPLFIATQPQTCIKVTA